MSNEEPQETGSIQPIGYIPMPAMTIGVAPAEGPAPAQQERRPGEATPPPGPAAESGRPEPQRPAVGPQVRVGRGAYVSPTASVVGDVVLGQEVFVGPGASVRGDAGARVYIGDRSNVQDGVVIHAQENRTVDLAGERFAVYVGKQVSLAHQCLIHGPVAIHDGCFVGFGATVLNSVLGRGCVVMHRAYVSDVEIPAGRLVPVGAVVDTVDRARSLPRVPADLLKFAESVVEANRRYARQYGEAARR